MPRKRALRREHITASRPAEPQRLALYNTERIIAVVATAGVRSSQILCTAALCEPFVGLVIRKQPFDEGWYRQGKTGIRTPGSSFAGQC
jgi:hypothetical protein